MKIWQSGQHHCLNWDQSDVVFEQTRLFTIVLLTYRSIVATLTGVIVVIYASFRHHHGLYALRTADFGLITH